MTSTHVEPTSYELADSGSIPDVSTEHQVSIVYVICTSSHLVLLLNNMSKRKLLIALASLLTLTSCRRSSEHEHPTNVMTTSTTSESEIDDDIIIDDTDDSTGGETEVPQLPSCVTASDEESTPAVRYRVHNDGLTDEGVLWGFEARHFYCDNSEAYMMFDPASSNLSVYNNGFAELHGVMHVVDDGCGRSRWGDHTWGIDMYFVRTTVDVDDDKSTYFTIVKDPSMVSDMTLLEVVGDGDGRDWVRTNPPKARVVLERQGILPSMGLAIDDGELPFYFDHATVELKTRVGLAKIDVMLAPTCISPEYADM